MHAMHEGMYLCADPKGNIHFKACTEFTACMPQEAPDAIPEGETPHSVTMLCFEDMIDMAKPGDRVTVTGIYKAQPVRVNPRNRAVKSVYKTHIMALHVQKDGQSQLFSLSGAALPSAGRRLRTSDLIGCNLAAMQSPNNLAACNQHCMGCYSVT